MDGPAVPKAFAAALDGLIARVREDRSILAAVLCGSLAHDTVWARSDIDIVFVTIDDRKVPAGGVPLYADGVNVHALLVPRTEFRRMVEGSVHQSFMHSYLAKGRLLYTHDDSIADLCKRLQSIGSRDAMIAMLGTASWVLPGLYKARKWIVTRGDYAYSALWLLQAMDPLAKMEVIAAGLLADREVIPQAARLNPALFKILYTDLLHHGTEKKYVEAALKAMEAYMAARAPRVFAPVVDYLKEVGDVRSSRDLDDYFMKNFGVADITGACEYLADLGLIGKASTAIHLTKRSNVTVEELAFFYLGDPDGA